MPPHTIIRHEDYVALLDARRIKAGIAKADSMRCLKLLPFNYQLPIGCCLVLWVILVAASVALGMMSVLLGIGVFIISTGAIIGAVQKSISDFVVSHSKEERMFYYALVESGLLIILPAE